MTKRVATIRLIMQGYIGLQVAQLLNLHRQSVSSYVKKFNEGGMDALLERPYAPGKKPYLSEEEEVQLKNMILESTPAQEGVGVEAYWNTRIIQHVLEEKFHVSMTRFGITKMLHRWGLSYTHPTYTLKRTDLRKQQEFQENVQGLKNASKDMVLIYED
jgi:transposase